MALRCIDVWDSFLLVFKHVLILEAHSISKHPMCQVLVKVEVHLLDRPDVLVYLRVGRTPVVENVHHPVLFF